MLKVGLYARVSTDEQVGPELSITNQIQRLERHLKSTFGEEGSKGYMVRKRYREEGRSGKDIAGRPELQELLSDVRQGAIDTVCCAELSRLSRSVGDTANILAEFDELGITFLCLNPAVNTSTASGKLVLNVMVGEDNRAGAWGRGCRWTARPAACGLYGPRRLVLGPHGVIPAKTLWVLLGQGEERQRRTRIG